MARWRFNSASNRSLMTEKAPVYLKGRRRTLDSVSFEGKRIIVTGRLPRIARLEKEFYEMVSDYQGLVDHLRCVNFRADLLTLLEKFPNRTPCWPFYYEMDNVAAIAVTTHEDWFKRRIPKQTRRAIRKAAERRVSVTKVPFDDCFVQGVVNIFNESPVRQGKPFWHFGKDFAEVKAQLSQDIERSVFLGAFHESVMIGFAKLILGDEYARSTLIVSMIQHRAHYPTNALISYAVDFCARRAIPFFVYGEYQYGKKGSDLLTAFKRHNGFERIELPRYFIPLSRFGTTAMRLGLQRGFTQALPKRVIGFGLRIRKWWSQGDSYR